MFKRNVMMENRGIKRLNQIILKGHESKRYTTNWTCFDWLRSL